MGRLRLWFSSHPPHLRALLATTATVLALTATPVVIFGMFVALGGETLLLEIGSAILLGTVLFAVGLATIVLAHVHTGFRDYNEHRSKGIVRVGTRILEAVTVSGLVLGLFAAFLSVALLGSVPTVVWVVLGGTTILLPLTVIAHATVFFGTTILVLSER
ncbi:hypothetical protein [Haloplanus sp.]|uniref:hypothetical protein n=1 Tax=Haloplanus sp. TaxID=1961696 RepID=UPI00260ABFF8|nr:hypothetical protein [Haloplanus sp.]